MIRAPRFRTTLALLVAVSLLGTACGRLKRRGAPSPQPKPAPAFQPGEWKSPKGEVFRPPAVADEQWRVMVVQEVPRQKKNPRWKKLKVDESFDFDMPPGTRYRCLVTPVSFRPWENEISSHVIKWDLIRSIRCSNDGWNTYVEAVHGVSMGGKGEDPTPTSRQAELYLHDWASGQRSEITLVLRWDGPVARPPRNVDD